MKGIKIWTLLDSSKGHYKIQSFYNNYALPKHSVQTISDSFIPKKFPRTMLCSGKRNDECAYYFYSYVTVDLLQLCSDSHSLSTRFLKMLYVIFLFTSQRLVLIIAFFIFSIVAPHNIFPFVCLIETLDFRILGRSIYILFFFMQRIVICKCYIFFIILLVDLIHKIFAENGNRSILLLLFERVHS